VKKYNREGGQHPSWALPYAQASKPHHTARQSEINAMAKITVDHITLGSVSHGTMRAEDLIPAFLSEIRSIEQAAGAALLSQTSGLAAELIEYDTEQADEILQELADALDQAAPFGYVFGAHPGDGSDFGFWIAEDWCDAFDDRCIDESDRQTLLDACADYGIDADGFTDAYEGEAEGWTEEEAGADYTQRMAEDTGMVDDTAKWPHCCIDWEEAWRQLSQDGYSLHQADTSCRWFVLRNC
jgi:hypothetical protein